MHRHKSSISYERRNWEHLKFYLQVSVSKHIRLSPFDYKTGNKFHARMSRMKSNLLKDFSFVYVKPNQNYHGGVGIYLRNGIQNFTQINLNYGNTTGLHTLQSWSYGGKF